MAQSKDPAMADQPDMDQLAKQYLDLWQDHAKSIAADPQIAQTMSQMTQMMTGSATAFAALAQQAMNAAKSAPQSPSQGAPGTTTDSESDDQAKDGQGAATARAAGVGAASPAAADGDGDLDLAGLARRIDELEQRLAALEAGSSPAGTGGTRKRTAKSPRKRSS
tara:strand:- start:803 stop:1297 length:495 start_codon:yes stop_codon:yes gene_type:complete